MGESRSDQDESGFRQRAAKMLDRLEAALERAVEAADVDLDVMRTDNVIEVELENGSRLVINSHEAAGEIWLAARSGGYHFQPGPEGWIDGRSGRELVAAVEAELSAQAGQAVDLRGL